MNLAHRIQLDPTHKQAEYFRHACGTARFVWNWALAEWNRQYENGEKPCGTDLKRQFNAIKYERFPWLRRIHRDAHSQPFSNLQGAFAAFFRKSAARPQFKKKGKCRDSFYIANDKVRIDAQRVRLPVIGWVRMTEPLRFTGKIIGAVVSREADRWFLSVQVDVGEYQRPRTDNGTVGVDLGVTTVATLSSGEYLEGPKPLKRRLRQLRRLSRRHSRKQKGSANRRKATMRLARLHRKIKNIRKDFLHKLTTRLCRENQAVGIEDLNVRGMVKNRRLARSVSDVGFYEFRRQLEYKSKIYGTQLVIADRWFPSSKFCHQCGWVNSALTLSDRTFRCDSCGMVMDRDLNAAKNLEALCTDGLSGTDACGPESAGRDRKDVVKLRRVEAGTKPRSL